MRKVRMIDPPEGWRFGFPKELPEGVDLQEWLFGEGYPMDLIPDALEKSRYWEEEREDE